MLERALQPRPPLAISIVLAMATGSWSAPLQEVPLQESPGNDPSGEGALAFVEIVLEPAEAFAGQPVNLGLRFGFEAQTAQHLVQLFRQELDLPAQVDAPWIDAFPPPSAPEEDDPESTLLGSERRQHLSFALNEGLARAERLADEVRAGKRFLVFEHRRSARFELPQERTLAAPALRYATTSGFAANLFEERVPTDRFDASVQGAGRSLRVIALPREGRPLDFSGAVGPLSVRAELPRATVTAGESFPLLLLLRGPGARLASPPELDLEGVGVLGVLDEGEGEGQERRWRYELVASRPGPLEIPALSVSFFDPGPPPVYSRARSEALALHIARRAETHPAPAEDGGPEGGPGGGPGGGPEFETEPDPKSARGWIAGFLVLAIGALVGWKLRSLRARSAALEPAMARRGSFDRAETALSSEEADPEGALRQLLAELLDSSPSAVVAPDLEARLRALGSPAQPARALARHLEALVAQRFGGPRVADARARTLEEVRALRRSLGI